MKPSTKASILMLTGSTLMLVGVFAKPLGIPTSFENVPILAAVVLIYFGYRLSKKATASGQVTPPSGLQRRRRFLLLAAVCALTCVAMPFLLPLTGVSLSLGKSVFVSIISFVLCLGAIWLGMKTRK